MDRDYVGLHGGGWSATLHPCLHVSYGHWKPGGELLKILL